MTDLCTPESFDQERLIKSNPIEKTIIRMDRGSRKTMKKREERAFFNWVTEYIFYFIAKRNLSLSTSIKEVKAFIRHNLNAEDLNHMPEIIFTEEKKSVRLYGWIPVFGWIYAYKHWLFKKRIGFLKSFMGEQMFSVSDLEEAGTRMANRNF